MWNKESHSVAAKVARERFAARIEHGRVSGARIIEKIQTEIPTDRIVSGKALRFDGEIDLRRIGESEGIRIYLPNKDSVEGPVFDMHRWALQQACGRVELPWKYVQHLMGEDRIGWGGPLVAYNLGENYKRSRSKYLLREYKGVIRGFLSDRYKRLDSRPLVEAFASACQKVGAVPIEGYGTDTKVGLTAVLPTIYEPVENEPLSFGVHWENSDYGNGRHDLGGFIDRAWCANGMIISLGFSQVHLGKRLTNDIIASDRTQALDNMTVASMIDDVVSQTLSEDTITLFCEAVRTASEEKIDVGKELKKLSRQLQKGEVDMITDKFNSPDVEMLPPGNTSWRLSNAISWVAGNSIEDEERKIELLKLAGTVIMARGVSSAVRGRRV